MTHIDDVVIQRTVKVFGSCSLLCETLSEREIAEKFQKSGLSFQEFVLHLLSVEELDEKIALDVRLFTSSEDLHTNIILEHQEYLHDLRARVHRFLSSI
jgi:hypothetical protein